MTFKVLGSIPALSNTCENMSGHQNASQKVHFLVCYPSIYIVLYMIYITIYIYTYTSKDSLLVHFPQKYLSIFPNSESFPTSSGMGKQWCYSQGNIQPDQLCADLRTPTTLWTYGVNLPRCRWGEWSPEKLRANLVAVWRQGSGTTSPCAGSHPPHKATCAVIWAPGLSHTNYLREAVAAMERATPS